MIQVPSYEIKESILPARKWNLNEEGKWRVFEEVELLNYEKSVEFQLKINLPAYNEVEYEANFSIAHWTREETNLLWELCEEFSLRFQVIHDRFNYEMKKLKGKYEGKTIEEIKERYFEINSKLTGDKFIYDKSIDQKRRMVLESYHSRSLEQSLEESFVVDYLSKLQQNGELESRLAERIETIKMLAGEQFTAGWPTLPELMKIASGKGVARLTEKNKTKKKKKKKPSSVTGGSSGNGNVPNSIETTSKPANIPSKPSVPPTKKVKTSSPLAQSGNFYLQSSQIHPLRVGSARAVEKILYDYNLPFKPDLPTAAVVSKFDQVRTSIIKLIDARKAAGLPPSKSLESSQSSFKSESTWTSDIFKDFDFYEHLKSGKSKLGKDSHADSDFKSDSEYEFIDRAWKEEDRPVISLEVFKNLPVKYRFPAFVRYITNIPIRNDQVNSRYIKEIVLDRLDLDSIFILYELEMMDNYHSHDQDAVIESHLKKAILAESNENMTDLAIRLYEGSYDNALKFVIDIKLSFDSLALIHSFEFPRFILAINYAKEKISPNDTDKFIRKVLSLTSLSNARRYSDKCRNQSL